MLAKRSQRTRRPRRGVTLVEMMVTVAVLVIMMTILVQIFAAATGALSAAQGYQQLDDQLRRLDGLVRTDLEGVTARFTPPLDPAMNLGYFEYGENEFADVQGEDGDDYIRFTAKAPAGRPFTGRLWPIYYGNGYKGGQNQPLPITVTSDYAEIIYFVRNGNLYRRVLLVAPEMQQAVNGTQVINNQLISSPGTYAFFPPYLQPTSSSTVAASWQGVNDLSAHPAATGSSSTNIVLNKLGDLTNRENRFAYPRFANDFWSASAAAAGQDGFPDDTNNDNLPDLYPTHYPNVFNTGLIRSNPTGNATILSASYMMAFPYIFPGAYSNAQSLPNNKLGYALGWIHSPTPSSQDALGKGIYQFDGTAPLSYLQNINHNPLESGDNVPPPPAGDGGTKPSNYQTWWGFPTWRETLTKFWPDPTVPLFPATSGGTTPTTLWAGGQPTGLSYGSWNGTNYDFLNMSNGYALLANGNLLPPMISSWTSGQTSVTYLGFRNPDQLFCDGAGSGSSLLDTTLWPLSWEDDLIMTGVRSFDVKAYDNALANYADLGWGDDYRLIQNQNDTNYAGATYPQAPFLTGSYDEVSQTYTLGASKYGNNQYWDLLGQTLAHEGRMPPLTNDFRLDAQFGLATNYLPASSTYLTANKGTYNNGNIGDDTVGVVRLRRVWDSWSTEYSKAPGTAIPVTGNGFPLGPPFAPPAYPSYPPPYPAPLRGIQIQIRVTDPANQRVKQLTIRQDFTDKL